MGKKIGDLGVQGDNAKAPSGHTIRSGSRASSAGAPKSTVMEGKQPGGAGGSGKTAR